MGPSTLSRAAPGRRTAAAVIALAAIAGFLPALRGGFVYDDEWLIRDNAHLRAVLDPAGDSTGGHLRALLLSDFSRIAGPAEDAAIERTGYFRPVVAASYLIDGFLWSRPAAGGATGRRAPLVFDPFGFHLTNLLLHAAVSLLVWAFARRLAGGAVGLIAGLTFAVHPIHTESVAWIAGRTDLTAALFGFTSLLCGFRSSRVAPGRWAARLWLALAIGSFALALAAKASAAFLPIVAVAAVASPRAAARCGVVASGRRFVPGLALAAVAIAWGAARFALAPDAAGATGGAWVDEAGEPLPLATVAASFVRALGWYLAKLVWPASFEPHADVAFAAPGEVVVAVLVHAAMLALAALLVWRGRLHAFAIGIAGVYVALLPVSSALPGTRLARAVEDHMFPVAERFLYFPSAFAAIAFGALAGGAIAAGLGGGARRRPWILAIAVAVAGLGLATSWPRAGHYRSNATFFAAARETAPRSIRVRCGLGRAALDAWAIGEALDQFRYARHLLRSRGRAASYPPIDAGLAAAHREKGDEPRRVEAQKRALNHAPRSWLPAFRLGITHWVNAVIHKDIARLDFAIQMIERARHLAPDRADVRRAAEHLVRTRDVWERYYVKREFDEDALVALARTFLVPATASLNEPGRPRWGDALKILHRALIAIPPASRLGEFPKAARLRRALERHYTETMKAAHAWYEAAITRHPKSAALHHQLGEILGIAWLRSGDGDARTRALEHFARCLDRAPGFLRAIVDEAALLKGMGRHAAAIARVRAGVEALLEPRPLDGWTRPMRPYEALDAVRFTAASPDLPGEWRVMAAEMIEKIVGACRRRAETGTNANHWDDLGWVLVYAGRTLREPARYDEARRAFTRALKYDPTHPRARANLNALEAELAKGPPK